ncbi:hypothetical protein [Schumannella luteola]|jgi:hypothetical protein
MHSWGDAVSEATQAELDRLLNSALRLAQSRLTEAAVFEPAALVVAEDSRVLELEPDRSGLGKHPEAEVVIDNAVRHLRRVRTEVRCTAVVFSTRLAKERTDAVEVRIEHRDGASAVVLMPYKKATFGGRTEYGSLKAFSSRREVWA